MKPTPTIKLIGKFIVSLIIKLTFFFEELFWMPIIKIKNNEELNTIRWIIFLIGKNISFYKFT